MLGHRVLRIAAPDRGAGWAWAGLLLATRVPAQTRAPGCATAGAVPTSARVTLRHRAARRAPADQGQGSLRWEVPPCSGDSLSGCVLADFADPGAADSFYCRGIGAGVVVDAEVLLTPYSGGLEPQLEWALGCWWGCFRVALMGR